MSACVCVCVNFKRPFSNKVFRSSLGLLFVVSYQMSGVPATILNRRPFIRMNGTPLRSTRWRPSAYVPEICSYLPLAIQPQNSLFFIVHCGLIVRDSAHSLYTKFINFPYRARNPNGMFVEFIKYICKGFKSALV